MDTNLVFPIFSQNATIYCKSYGIGEGILTYNINILHLFPWPQFTPKEKLGPHRIPFTPRIFCAPENLQFTPKGLLGPQLENTWLEFLPADTDNASKCGAAGRA